MLIAYNFYSIKGTNFSIVTQDDDQVEVSFTRTWDPSLQGKLVPLNIDKRYINLVNYLISILHDILGYNLLMHAVNYLKLQGL